MGLINAVEFSPTGKYLAIASEEQNLVVYDYAKKQFVKCRPGHSGSLLTVFFSPDEKVVCSTGTDGYLRAYKMDEAGEWTLLSSFHICPKTPSSSLAGCFNPKGSLIAVPGRPVLQQIDVLTDKLLLTLNPSIKHESDITLCHWQTNEAILTACSKTLCAWNYHTGDKILSIDSIALVKIRSYQDTFVAIDSKGSLYEFQKNALFKIQEQKPVRESVLDDFARKESASESE